MIPGQNSVGRNMISNKRGRAVTGANFRAPCLALGRCEADKFGEGRDLGAGDAEAGP
jgi:hypothetical protein